MTTRIIHTTTRYAPSPVGFREAMPEDVTAEIRELAKRPPFGFVSPSKDAEQPSG